MINNDIDALNIIESRLEIKEINKYEKEILTIVKLLMKYYSFTNNQTYPRPNHPRPEKRKDAYFTLIAIILSLRTTLENEMQAVEKFCNRYKNIYEVVNADKNELIEIIKCAGMPNKKAENIIKISKYIIENYNGDINSINDGDIDKIRKKLFEIPGLGEKSVDCMLELAFDLPSIVIDTNVFRVMSRLFFSDAMSFEKKNDILKIKGFIESNIYPDYRLYQIIHTILLLHGKNTCKSKPCCEKCILNEYCHYYEKKDFVLMKLF